MKANYCLAVLLVCGAAITPAAMAKSVPPPVLFPEKWIDGTMDQEPYTQVQALDSDTFVIRQSVKTNFEAPFLYLLFGKDKALLVDSGAKDGRIRPAVDRLIADWLKAHNRSDIPLVVAHSHSHGDHIAGDAAFRDRPNTTVVGLKPSDVPGGIRTHGPQIRNLVLYPAELRSSVSP
jgi:hydroxyacylglutathione hydrolase